MASAQLLAKIAEAKALLDKCAAEPLAYAGVLYAIGANNAAGVVIAQATADFAKSVH